MRHGAAGNVVQGHQAPVAGPAIGQTALQPAIRIAPVARHRVPQNAGDSERQNAPRHRGMQQIVADHAAAIGTKQTARLFHPGQSFFCTVKLRQRFPLVHLAQPLCMRKRVVADPVAFRSGAARNRAGVGADHLGSQDKECGFYFVAREAIDNAGSNRGLGAVVETKRYSAQEDL